MYMQPKSNMQPYGRRVTAITVLTLVVALLSAMVAPVRTTYAANQLILNPVGGPFGMVVLRLPSGGEAAFTLEGATFGTSFVRMRVDWAAADTRVQQIRITNVPGGPILGFDLNPSIFSPQPRDPNQIVLNVQPPARSFHDSFIFELAGGLAPSQVIGQFLIEDLTTGATVEKSNVPIIFDPRVTNSTIDLSGGGTQAGGVILGSGGQITGGNGASVTGQVTTLPGSTVKVTQGQLTLGDRSAPVDLRGLVDVQPNATLKLESSGKTYLGGQTEVTHGTISASNGMVFGTTSAQAASQLAAIDLEAALLAVGADRNEALQQAIASQVQLMQSLNQQLRDQQLDARARRQLEQEQQLEMLRLQSLALKQNATYELTTNLIKSATAIASPIVANIRSTLDGDVEVVGTLQIGGSQAIGHTDVTGRLTLHTASQLAMEAAGTGAGQFDSVTVAGNVTFDNGSTLKLGLLDPNDFTNGTQTYVPELYSQLDILTAAQITNNGLVLDAPAFPDRILTVSIVNNPNGTQTLRLITAQLPVPTPPSSDTTPPVITPNVVGTLGANGWYRSDVSVNWTVSDPESAIASQTGCDAVTINADTAGATLTCSATSAGGTGTQAVTVKRDATAPTLNPSVSPNPVNLGASATTSSGAADALSGLASQSCGALDTSTVGAKTVACTARDNAGNTANANSSYSVIYSWSGFFQPVDNLPVLNQVKAGSAVPVKFSLGGNQGLSILTTGSPASQQIACDGGVPVADIEQTVSAGNSSLSYDPTTGQYSYTWKTEKSWANTCRQLIMTLADGTQHVANFKFK